MSRLSNTDLSVNEESSSSKGEYSWGAKAIGRAIERSPRQAYYMLTKGLIKSAKQFLFAVVSPFLTVARPRDSWSSGSHRFDCHIDIRPPHRAPLSTDADLHPRAGPKPEAWRARAWRECCAQNRRSVDLPRQDAR